LKHRLMILFSITLFPANLPPTPPGQPYIHFHAALFRLRIVLYQRIRDKQFALLKSNPQHPSLQFKKLGDRNGQEIWSARVTLKYRASAVKLPDEYLWFWVGEHNVYDALIK
jgi:hypothetical protein